MKDERRAPCVFSAQRSDRTPPRTRPAVEPVGAVRGTHARTSSSSWSSELRATVRVFAARPPPNTPQPEGLLLLVCAVHLLPAPPHRRRRIRSPRAPRARSLRETPLSAFAPVALWTPATSTSPLARVSNHARHHIPRAPLRTSAVSASGNGCLRPSVPSPRRIVRPAAALPLDLLVPRVPSVPSHFLRRTPLRPAPLPPRIATAARDAATAATVLAVAAGSGGHCESRAMRRPRCIPPPPTRLDRRAHRASSSYRGQASCAGVRVDARVVAHVYGRMISSDLARPCSPSSTSAGSRIPSQDLNGARQPPSLE
ncbi:hypothetical protein B0H17DRAFT_1206841 [Mycena rosella]|uniref:Uncharacterized protein n=1 Tax=Mycena rosella TaxID=1033263 RepID=A0AAD7D4M4_MYCRO|nr:hypothetical protein B0H17DRAFT_1206841 [Mycena rosella]